MGEVYRARDPRLDREVAIKVLAPGVAQDPVRLERFIREARAVAALNHPHIVTIYSTEEADGVPFLTMELVEGRTLDAVLKSGGMPLGDLLDIAIPLADALSAAHAKRITHRDLKPSNVMVTDEGRVKVLDFGLARVAEAKTSPVEATATRALLTAEGTIVGTMPYMSPEQIAGQAVDHRSDLFSLGIMLYEMASGVRPFHGASSPLLMSSILRDAPPPIRESRPDVPDAIAWLVSRLLEKRPDDRVQTARDVYKQLREVQKALTAGGPVTVEDKPRRAQDVPANPSVAVLSFTDLSASGDQAWFGDGIAEDVLNALSQVQGLKTIARRSSFALKGADADPREVGRLLDVGHALTGSVRRAGDRVRVTAQLVSTTDGRQVWSDRYDRAVDDVFAIQDEIARAIVQALTGALLSDAGVRRATPSMPAYEALLRGRHDLYSAFTPESWQRAKAQFERAIALDPSFAEPHAQLGLVHFVSGMHGLQPMTDVAPNARAHVDRALALNPSDPVPRFVLGAIAVAFEHDWTAAEAHFRAATDAPQAPAEAHWLFASLYFGALGRYDESVAEMWRAVEKDPLNGNWRAIYAAHLINAGRLDDAIAHASRAVTLDASNWATHLILGEAHLAAGSLPRAEAALEAACAVAPWNSRPTLLLAAIKVLKGDRTTASRMVAAAADAVQPWPRMQYHLLVGELDTAADWYERMIDTCDPFALVYAAAPVMRPLHAHPRWSRIAARLNLPAAPKTGSASDSVRRSVSIAVGEFVARSSDEESRALADGIPDSVIVGLSAFPYLSVTGRRVQGARYVVEGSVRRAGGSVRIVVHLADSTSGAHLWAETYTRELAAQDMFDLQDDIADRIIATVGDPHGVLMRSIVENVRHRPLEELEPRDLILRYWAYDHQHTPAEHAKLRDAFGRALAKYPHDAELWAAASRLAAQEFMFAFEPRPDPLGRARRAASRAVELDPNGQFGWEALAIAAFFSRDREGFLAAAERAVAINPRNANTLAWIASLFAHLGEIGRAEPMIRRAVAINPQHPGWYYFPLWIAHASREEWTEALQVSKKVNMPQHIFEPIVTAQACVMLGRMEEAHAAFERFRALAPAMAADRGAIAEQLKKWGWATGKWALGVEMLWKAATPPERDV